MDSLFVAGCRVTSTAVVANYGNPHGVMAFDRDVHSAENRLDQVIDSCFRKDQVRPGLGNRVHEVDVEPFLQVSDDWQLDSSVHAVDGCAESHHLFELAGCR